MLTQARQASLPKIKAGTNHACHHWHSRQSDERSPPWTTPCSPSSGKTPAIKLVAKGAMIDCAGGKISQLSNGVHTIKSSKFEHLSGGDGTPEKIKTSNLEDQHDQQVILTDQRTDMPAANRKYRITVEDGQVIEGMTNDKGLTQRFHTKVTAALDARLKEISTDDRLRARGPLMKPDSVFGKVINGAIESQKIVFGAGKSPGSFYSIESYQTVGQNVYVQSTTAYGDDYKEAVAQLNEAQFFRWR